MFACLCSKHSIFLPHAFNAKMFNIFLTTENLDSLEVIVFSQIKMSSFRIYIICVSVWYLSLSLYFSFCSVKVFFCTQVHRNLFTLNTFVPFFIGSWQIPSLFSTNSPTRLPNQRVTSNKNTFQQRTLGCTVSPNVDNCSTCGTNTEM